ncbi:MAG: radical SAM protein [Flavobacteriales bacterium]|nr:radical SAM protein [Flavobacteriales bacterium]
MKEVLLITPPFTQLNTPYPATAYLKGFLNTKNIRSYQMDLGIEVILELFKRSTFQEIFELANQKGSIETENCERIYHLRDSYLKSIEPVVNFLQGKDQTFARQICSNDYLPQASRFDQVDDLDWAFGNMGIQDKAKHLATLFLEDLSDFIIECIDPNFGFSRYAERLGQSANSFNDLYAELNEDVSFIDNITLAILKKKVLELSPKLICFSVPFPGNLYSAFRCAKFIKKECPNVKIAMGGGFPNTELRSLSDIRVFEFFDYISLDDGEKPIELIYKHVVSNTSNGNDLKRTYTLQNNEVMYTTGIEFSDYKQNEIGTPDYSDLLLSEYISVIEITNPMHTLWSDGRWNKLTMAHGCYWGKCTFCDISLDYIKIYEPITANLLVDRMEEIISQTGETGFHFVDEAAPPSLMKALAIEILNRDLTVTWWTNIRFEKNFSSQLCKLLKASGCIAVSGGLEVASDRLLSLIDKGVTVEQVAQVTDNFTESGIMVHSYLMYGYPTQTVQETIDSLEMVRQLFELGVIQSGFWHQFALTTHSPIGMNPDEFNITPNYKDISFANNDVDFKDITGIDHTLFSDGLKKSLFNFMHGVGFELPLKDWFDFKVPKTSISKNFIQTCIEDNVKFNVKPSSRVIWLGAPPIINEFSENIKDEEVDMLQLFFHTKTDVVEITLEQLKGEWLLDILERLSDNTKLTYKELRKLYEEKLHDFELFWYSEALLLLRENLLLLV